LGDGHRFGKCLFLRSPLAIIAFHHQGDVHVTLLYSVRSISTAARLYPRARSSGRAADDSSPEFRNGWVRDLPASSSSTYLISAYFTTGRLQSISESTTLMKA